MHCGWMDDAEWLYPIRLANKFVGQDPSRGMDGVEWTADVCPGWAVRQPMIEEIAQAKLAFETGSLSSLFPDIVECIAEGIYEKALADAQYERNRLANLDKESGKPK